MKKGKALRRFAIVLVALSLITLASCLPTQTSSFYDAGASNFTATGSQFSQYFFFRFDTQAAKQTFTLPSAADIVAASSPTVHLRSNSGRRQQRHIGRRHKRYH